MHVCVYVFDGAHHIIQFHIQWGTGRCLGLESAAFVWPELERIAISFPNCTTDTLNAVLLFDNLAHQAAGFQALRAMLYVDEPHPVPQQAIFSQLHHQLALPCWEPLLHSCGTRCHQSIL